MIKDTYFCNMVRSFTYKNIPIQYTDTGKGRVVVLFHGFLEDSTMWSAIVPKFSKQNRVICVDLLGHGASGSLGYIHTMEEQAMLVKAVLNHLHLRKYILIGHSMGGYVALAFTELYPKSVRGLCLMNSSALADSEEKKINRDRALKNIKKNYRIFVSVAIPNLFSENSRLRYKAEIKKLTQEALQLTPQSIIAATEGIKIRKDRTHLLKEGTYKKLLIIGKKDSLLDYNSLIQQTDNTDVGIVEFPDGHMSHIENKDSLIATLKDFIKSCN